MASEGAVGERAAPAGAVGGAGGGAGGGGGAVQHPSPFKLRFAAGREAGRSLVSAVRPRGLPARVTDKFYARERPGPGGEGGEAGEEHMEDLVRRVRDAFAPARRPPAPAPALSSHQYGWWAGEGAGAGCGASAAPRADRRLHHHIRDSAWLRARLRVLCAAPALR